MDKLKTTHKWFIFLIPLVVAMASFVMGYFMVYFTMMEEDLQRLNSYTSEQSELYFTLTMALLPVGAFIASFFYEKFVFVYGENKVMRMMNVVAVVAIILQLVSLHTIVLSISRFLMGFYCGITSGIIPSYILSLSPSFTSGIVGAYNQMAIALGMAFAYYMGQFLDDASFSESTAVKMLVGFPILCIFVHTVILFLHPYDNIERHIMRRENNVARKYLKFIYGANWKAFELEIQQYKVTPIEIEQPNKSTRDLYNEENFQADEVKKGKSCKCTKFNFILMAVMLATANQLSGITTVLEYAKQLFLTIQEGDQSEADISVLVLGFFQVLVTFTSGFLINKFGRRPMMLIGLAILVISLLTGFMVTWLVEKHESITVIVVFTHVLGYSISLGPICMIYAVQALDKIGLVLIINWGLYALITLAGDYLIESLGLSIMFLGFGVCSVISFLFFYSFMSESKNTPRKKMWEQIEGIKIDWEKTFNLFSESHLNKKSEEKKPEESLESQLPKQEAAPDKSLGTI